MIITKITATASRTFNHPTERYANFRFTIGAEAELDLGETMEEAADALRSHVENIAEGHKQQILKEIEHQRLREQLATAIRNAEAMPQQLLKWQEQLKDAGLSDYRSQDIADQIQDGQTLFAALPSFRKDLAAIPRPMLLPLPEIHPGHPDHPDTEDFGGERY